MKILHGVALRGIGSETPCIATESATSKRASEGAAATPFGVDCHSLVPQVRERDHGRIASIPQG